ncbi:pirin family protein [bacterium SCSIO 12643]|nr:pirin family protein [bacterium SCSIO 12643]
MEKRGLLKFQEPRNGIQYIVNTDIRTELKPLVFFDAGKFTRSDDGFTIGYHPHSGIGIITYFHGTDLHHKDSADHPGVIHDGGMQWIRAGKGVWHEEGYHRKHNAQTTGEWTGSIHQLWIQLPPELEESEVVYENLPSDEIAVHDHVKVLAGTYQGVKGKIDLPIEMTYLDVSLKAGETWKFETPKGQTTGFVFTRDGAIKLNEELIENNKMAILEHKEGVLQVEAHNENSNFIVVLAKPESYPSVTHGGQIHTNEESLLRSLEHIKKIGGDLKS